MWFARVIFVLWRLFPVYDRVLALLRPPSDCWRSFPSPTTHHSPPTTGAEYKSKRISLAQKYGVQKKIRQHHRKERKLAKKGVHKKTLKKDPGIPNLYPFKEQLLASIEEFRQKKEEEKRSLRDKHMHDVQSEANEKDEQYEQEQQEQEQQEQQPIGSSERDNTSRAYYREFRKVVDAADVVLQVLDARDPTGSRCTEIEQMVQSNPKKKLVLVLNKIDLVPRENVEAWLRYLRQFFPTVAFKASTQQQRGTRAQRALSFANPTAAALGADALLNLLKNYSRSHEMKASISVGIVGYPNVGKSSLINSLKRVRAVGVSSTPGFTKQTQEVILDKNLKLIDTPGIVFAAARGTADADIILRNAVKVEQIVDPIPPVEAIVRRCGAKLSELYTIAGFQTTAEFLVLVAQKRGKLSKGGVLDLEATARSVITDWNTGKIKFFTQPPEIVRGPAEVVSELAPELDLDSFLSELQPVRAIQVDPSEIPSVELNPERLFLVDAPKPAPALAPAPAPALSATARLAMSQEHKAKGKRDTDDANPQHGRDVKRAQKKQRKDARRGESALERGIDALSAVSLGGDTYSFNDYYREDLPIDQL